MGRSSWPISQRWGIAITWQPQYWKPQTDGLMAN